MNLLKRIIVAIIFIPLLLFIFYVGDIPLMSLLMIISVIMIQEFREMLINKKIVLSRAIIPLNAVLFLCSLNFSLQITFFVFLGIFLFLAARYIFTNQIKDAFQKIAYSIFGIFYTGFLFSFIFHIRNFANGAYLVLIMLILTWITDSVAYFVGKHLGKHRRLFSASPNKSLEGFVGGIAAAFIFACLFQTFLQISFQNAIFLGLTTGIFGQFGDLFESMLKRDFDRKDSSAFLPGHGGILDRFDSLLFAAPTLFALLTIFN